MITVTVVVFGNLRKTGSLMVREQQAHFQGLPPVHLSTLYVDI